MNITQVAFRMFAREAATYDADPDTVAAMWAGDLELRAVWVERAQAVADDLEAS